MKINQEQLDRLNSGINKLRGLYPKEIAAEPRSLVARLVVLGYMREVVEMATATATLLESDTPRAAYSTARGAFEAARNLMLIRYSDDPALAGASAYAAERMDELRSSRRARRALGEILEFEPTDVPEHVVDDVIQEDASFLDGLIPSSGQVLWDGLGEVREAYSRGRWHWSGMTQEEITRAVDTALRGEGRTSTSETWTWANDQLSRNTHANPRCYPPYLEVGGGKGFQFNVPGKEDAEEVAGTALASALIAVEATMLLLPEIEARLP